jgi:sec-independent protein translocase protein TatB
MEILGIGPSELLFIIILALIVLGPKDMQKAGKTVGRWLNNLVRSDGWKAFQQTSREIRGLPTKLMRDANLEIAEAEREVRKAMGEKTSYRPIPQKDLDQPKEPENTIQPPPAKPTDAEPQPNEKDS